MLIFPTKISCNFELPFPISQVWEKDDIKSMGGKLLKMFIYSDKV